MFKFFYTGKRVDKSPGDSYGRAASPNLGRFLSWWGRRRLAVRISIIAVASVLLLVMGTALAVRLYVRAPDDNEPIIPNIPTPSSTIMPSGTSPDSEDPDDQTDDEIGFVKRDGVYTFLLAGLNEGLTDTLMVATLDTEQKTCHVLSIPRDTVIENATRRLKKINSAYTQQKNVDEPGIAQLKKEVGTLIGFQPQYAAIVDYNAFVKLIDTIKGVDFNVPMNMYVAGEGINLRKGQQTLTGNQALQLVRFRVNADGTGYNDYGRMETQQQLLIAAAKKALSNWTKFPEYLKIAQENVTGDIDWGQMLWFAEQVNNIGMDNVVFNVLPTYSVHAPAELDDGWYEAVLPDEALELINLTINPFSIDIEMEMLEYMKLTETAK